MMIRLAAVVILCALGSSALRVDAQEAAPAKKIKSGLTTEDWKYSLADGVSAKDVTYFSDDVGCYAKIFFPKGYSTTGKMPGIVLGQGWTGTHHSIAKYGPRLPSAAWSRL
ncbi:MAG: hypothetical protein ABI882_08745 [Acidobacteriota bacterium]